MTRKLLCNLPRVSISKHGTIKCDQHFIQVQCPKKRRKNRFDEECLVAFKRKRKEKSRKEELIELVRKYDVVGTQKTKVTASCPFKQKQKKKEVR